MFEKATQRVQEAEKEFSRGKLHKDMIYTKHVHESFFAGYLALFMARTMVADSKRGGRTAHGEKGEVKLCPRTHQPAAPHTL